ncbi:BppU family phage baseplate upper protein [Clostridium sp. 1001275B_160808_H3]|uniref:BppU family phage baseplate upper protein n=1 Tax=Clostridium sp. 1001275B_160808_H3 TaxID=2787110 RepID=UPI0018985170
MASKIVVNLDTSKELYGVFKCKQNDDLILEVSIYENNLEKDLTNSSVVIQAKKVDNTYVIQNTDITKEKNKFIANLVRDFTRVSGKTEIEVVLTESSKQNTTFSFTLEVVGSVIRGAVESSNTATILEKLQDKIVEAGAVKEETEQLIENGGAATTGQVKEITASLEQMSDYLNYMPVNGGTFEDFDGNGNTNVMIDGGIY